MKLESYKAISDEDSQSAQKTIITIFNLDFDLKTFYGDVKNDAVMAKLVKELKGLNSPTTRTVFEALVSSSLNNRSPLKPPTA